VSAEREALAAALRTARFQWRGGSDGDFDDHLADAVLAHQYGAGEVAESTTVIDYAAWSERDQDFKCMARGHAANPDAMDDAHAHLNECLHGERGRHPWRLRDVLHCRTRTSYPDYPDVVSEWTPVQDDRKRP
jgi:hypothetical protein